MKEKNNINGETTNGRDAIGEEEEFEEEEEDMSAFKKHIAIIGGLMGFGGSST